MRRSRYRPATTPMVGWTGSAPGFKKGPGRVRSPGSKESLRCRARGWPGLYLAGEKQLRAPVLGNGVKKFAVYRFVIY